MDTPFDATNPESNIVYIRPLSADDVPPEVLKQVGPRNFAHAILSEDGNVIGLAPNREAAFIIARDHAFSPMSVH